MDKMNAFILWCDIINGFSQKSIVTDKIIKEIIIINKHKIIRLNKTNGYV